MKCPQCGHQNAKHYKFCLECGAEIPSVAIDSTKPVPVKRVGISEAFSSSPERNPSPATLIRQVEDISSDLGMGSPLTTPPPLGIKAEGARSLQGKFSTPASAKDKPREQLSSFSKLKETDSTPGSSSKPKLEESLSESSPSPIPEMESAPAMPMMNVNDLNPVASRANLLNIGPSLDNSESPDLDFHTSLNQGRDSLADFERELFGGALTDPKPALMNTPKPSPSDSPPPAPDELSSTSPLNEAQEQGTGSIPQTGPSAAGSPSNAQEERVVSRSCPQCSAIVPADFLFCGRCGAKMEVSDLVPDPEIEANATPEIQSPRESHSLDLELANDPISSKGMDGGSSQVASHESQIDHGSSGSSEDSQAIIQLIHIHLDGSEGQSIEIKTNDYLLGREHQWEVFQSDDYLSPQHAKITRSDEGQVSIVDLGGINGIFIRLTKSFPLKPGDFFRAGQQLFAYEEFGGQNMVTDQEETKKLGSPYYETWGRLSHIVGQGEMGRAWLLHGESVNLGRVKGDIIFDQDRFMSSKHCTLTNSQDGLLLTDTGSTNGTFVRIRGSIILEDNDLILLGQKIFKVNLSLNT